MTRPAPQNQEIAQFRTRETKLLRWRVGGQDIHQIIVALAERRLKDAPQFAKLGDIKCQLDGVRIEPHSGRTAE